MSVAPDRLSPHQDTFYHALMDAHSGLSEADSHALNARLVLMMANEIGDVTALQKLLSTARGYTDA